MMHLVKVAVLATALVYPVYGYAQPAMVPAPAMATATSHTSAPAPAPVMVAPKAPEPAVMAVASPAPMDVAPAMAPVAPPVTTEAPKPPPAPVVSDKPAAAGTAAPAAPVAAPAKSGWGKADEWIGRLTNLLLLLLGVIATILGWTKAKDWRQTIKSSRWGKILLYAKEHAFPMVESLAASTAWKGDDKLVEFMKRLNDWLLGEGDRPLSAQEEMLLKREAADLAAAAKADDPEKAVDPAAVTRAKAA